MTCGVLPQSLTLRGITLSLWVHAVSGSNATIAVFVTPAYTEINVTTSNCFCVFGLLKTYLKKVGLTVNLPTKGKLCLNRAVHLSQIVNCAF